MAPVNQLGVLAFASAVLAVPHAQWQPFKRHAHPSAPAYGVPSSAAPVSSDPAPAYGSSSAPAYGASSVAPVSSADPWSSAPAYPSASGSSYSAGAYGSSSYSAGAYGSSSYSYGPSSVSSGPVPSGTPDCWSKCFGENGVTSESDLCDNSAVSACIHGTCSPAEDKAYWDWYTSYCSASSSVSVEPVSSSGVPPYPYGSSSGFAVPTGGYGSSYSFQPTGYPSASYSVCTETSTLIWKSTTSYSTFYVTHTLYESAPASSVAPASEGPGYSAPAYSGPAGPGYSSPASPADGSCVPDVTVTETVKTTVYVTPGAPSEAAPAPSSEAAPVPSSEAAPSYGGGSWGAPSSVAAVPSSEAAPSYPAGAPSSAPSSAPAPSYSAPASGSFGKRGIAYNDVSLANSLAGGPAGGWAYNWISNGDGLDSSIPYIPMLHDASSDFTSTWQADAQKGIANGAEYLFSFNEPDMSSQANLSPEAAAAAWKQYMEPFAGQAKLVAPSVTNGQDANMGLNWLQAFFDACTGCTIDAVAQHWYFPTNDVDNFKDQISKAAGMAGGKGVFLSEFGAVGSDDEKAEFLKEVLPWLDSSSDVIGYSYFMVADGSLMTGDSPSTYGEVYCN